MLTFVSDNLMLDRMPDTQYRMTYVKSQVTLPVCPKLNSET
ncbi:MAG: hypothetical protein PUC65_17450 [Clostridiales bacterium]|nr:hypothetical protein [Clostridiales bacterium]